MTDGRCPVCLGPLPERERPHGGRNARYCSGACRARAYRARRRNAAPAGTRPPPLTGDDRHARVIEIRQQASELMSILADTATGQQALFGTPGSNRRPRPADAAVTLHKLIAELALLAADTAVTKRVTLRRSTNGNHTPPLFDQVLSETETTPSASCPPRPGTRHSDSSNI